MATRSGKEASREVEEFTIETVGAYAGEAFNPPRSWTEKYFNLQQYRVHDQGGYFAPLEVPDTFLHDVRACFAWFR